MQKLYDNKIKMFYKEEMEAPAIIKMQMARKE